MKTKFPKFLSYWFSVCSLYIFASMALAANNFVTVNLPKGVTVELPKNWIALSDNKRVTLDASSQAMLESRKLVDVEHDFPFSANYYDDSGKFVAGLSIRYYPAQVVSQNEARNFNIDTIKQLDEGLHVEVKKGVEAAGGRMLVWFGTAKQDINHKTYFVSDYRQFSQHVNKSIRTRLVRLINGHKSFTIVLSYREDEEALLKPICEKIINSIIVKSHE